MFEIKIIPPFDEIDLQMDWENKKAVFKGNVSVGAKLPSGKEKLFHEPFEVAIDISDFQNMDRGQIEEIVMREIERIGRERARVYDKIYGLKQPIRRIGDGRILR